MKMIVAAAALLVSPALAAGATSSRIVDAASRAFDDAQFRGDAAALQRFLDPDFVYVQGTGLVAGRRAFIANFTDPRQHLDPFVIRHRRVIALGRDAAVVVAEGIISGTDSGRTFRQHFRYADTFVRRNGRWLVAYVQVTPVAR